MFAKNLLTTSKRCTMQHMHLASLSFKVLKTQIIYIYISGTLAYMPVFQRCACEKGTSEQVQSFHPVVIGDVTMQSGIMSSLLTLEVCADSMQRWENAMQIAMVQIFPRQKFSWWFYFAVSMSFFHFWRELDPAFEVSCNIHSFFINTTITVMMSYTPIWNWSILG